MLPPNPTSAFRKGQPVPGCPALRLKAEDEHERLVHCSQLGHFETTRRTSETFRIHDRGLLYQDPRLGAVHPNDRSKARGPGASRGWRDEDRTQAEQLVRLDDYSVACPPLLVPACSLRCGEAEELASHHLRLVLWSGSQFAHVLTDCRHLSAIVWICRQARGLLHQGRTRPSPRRGLAKSGANRVGVVQAIRSNELERCLGRGVEPDVERSGHERKVARFVLHVPSGRSPRGAKEPGTTA
jgi:hypothetical protein